MADHADINGSPPLTYTAAEAGYYPAGYGAGAAAALKRFEGLRRRALRADAGTNLVARGAYAPAAHGDRDEEPLTVAEHLEMLAIGEVLSRYCRYPSRVHHAVRSGATWKQIAAATGATEAGARQEYREWAEDQYQQWGVWGLGLDDAEYAEAIARAEEAPDVCLDAEPAMVTAPRDDLRLAVSALWDLAAHGSEPLGDFAGRLTEAAGLTAPASIWADDEDEG